MKNTKLVLLMVLSVPVILLSCKKDNPGTPSQHGYTSVEYDTVHIIDTVIVAMNSQGQWVATGTSRISPAIDSLTIKGFLSYQVWDGYNFKFTQQDNTAVIGVNTVDILPSTLVSPYFKVIDWEIDTYTSNGYIDHIITFR